eukprot:TCONS_00068875-protein
MNFRMKIIFLLCVVICMVQCKKKHVSSSASSHTRRSKISSSMPSLGDSPETNSEEAVSTNDDGDDSVDDHQSHQKGSKRGKISSENAANFGNNVVVKEGINPSAAFVVKEENHKGFQGRDKVIHQKNDKNNKTKKKFKQAKKSKQSKDHDMMARLKKIAKEIADVEHKKEEKAAIEASQQNKKKGKKVKSIDKDISTENSHGRSDATLLSNKPSVHEPFQCPWSCFWTCSAYCPAECCNNPYSCPLSCKTICAPQCKDKCCAPGARKLPKLQLPLIQPERNVSPKLSTFTNTQTVNTNVARPLSTFPKLTSYGRDISEKIKILKQQSNYAANLLQGFTSNCPALCSKVCTPIVCRRSCCTPYPQQQQQPLSQYAAIAPQRTSSYSFYQQSQQRAYCPPICQSSCIEQCPNQCCTTAPRPYL